MRASVNYRYSVVAYLQSLSCRVARVSTVTLSALRHVPLFATINNSRSRSSRGVVCTV